MTTRTTTKAHVWFCGILLALVVSLVDFKIPQSSEYWSKIVTRKSRVEVIDNGTDNDTIAFIEHLSETVDCRSKVSVSCGNVACWFPDKTNASIGHLIAQDESAGTMMKTTWNSSKYLKRTFGVRHFLSGPPHELHMSSPEAKDLLACLSSLVKSNLITNDSMAPLTVQPSMPFPSPRLLLDLETIHVRGPSYAKEVIESFIFENVHYRQKFRRQIESEIDLALPIWEKEPHLCNNYRMVLDKNGHMYHFAPKMRSAPAYHSEICTRALLATLQAVRETIVLDLYDNTEVNMSSILEKYQFQQIATSGIADATLGNIQNPLKPVGTNNDGLYKSIFEKIDCNSSSPETPYPCESSKCLFPDRVNSSLGYKIGMVGKAQHNMNEWITIKYLENKYNISHSQLEPPHLLSKPANATQDLTTCLIQHVDKKEKPKMNESLGTFLFQRNQVFQGPLFEIKFEILRKQRPVEFKNNFQEFLRVHVGDHSSFLTKASKEFALAIHMLINEPYLCSDYQIFLDSGGKMHFFGVPEIPTDQKQRHNVENAYDCIQFLDSALDFLIRISEDLIIESLGLGVGHFADFRTSKKYYYPNNDEMYERLYERIGCRNLKEERKQKAPCGATKCWFPDETDPSIGYLIAQDSDWQKWRQFATGYIDAKVLELKYNVTHSQLESPQRLKMPDNSNLDLLGCLRFQAVSNRDKQEQFLDDTSLPLIVQTNKAFPAPLFHLRPGEKNLHQEWKQQQKQSIEWFVEHHVTLRSEFLQNMEREMNLAITILTKETYLCSDYQVMLDPFGHIHYFDMRGRLIDFRDPKPCIEYMDWALQTMRDKIHSIGRHRLWET